MGYGGNNEFGYSGTAGSGPSTITGAAEGASIAGNTVVLGQDFGDPGNPAELTSVREIPASFFGIALTAAGINASLVNILSAVAISLIGDQASGFPTSVNVRDIDGGQFTIISDGAGGMLINTPLMNLHFYASGNLGIATSSDNGAKHQVAGNQSLGVVAGSSNQTLDSTAAHWVFTGTTATWKLPPVVDRTGWYFLIKNRGSGNLTLASDGGGNDIYSSSAVSSFVINAGQAVIVVNDGTFYLIE